MILNTTLAGLLGPYALIELGDDRAFVDGAEVPYTVVGACNSVDLPLPVGAQAADYELVDGELVKREQLPPDADSNVGPEPASM